MGGRGASGGVSASKINNPALSLQINGQTISQLVAPYIGKYKYIGIRTQEEEFELGDISHRSVVWRNGEETTRQLSGISATSVKSEAIAAHSDIKKDYSELRKYKNSGWYFGDNVAIIVGNSASRGSDVGELVIKDPKVVKIIKRKRR